MRWATFSLFAVAVVGCSSTDSSSQALSTPFVSTETETIVTGRSRLPETDSRNPASPESRAALYAEGFGAFGRGPGESVTQHYPDGSAPKAPGPKRKRLARFAHLADMQLADDKSPVRVAAFDTAGLTDGAYRPQEPWGCRILDAAVRTVNRAHRADPIDLVLLGGDNIDNAQQNELDWFVSVLEGDPTVTCDSGDPTKNAPGAESDAKKPFAPAGLTVPWYWMMGNHDILVQGVSPVDAARKEQSVGSNASTGTRDYSQPGAPVVRDEVPADMSRMLLDRPAMVSRLMSRTPKHAPKGYGLGAYASEQKVSNFTVDIAGSNVRIIAVDTAAETGGADGLIRRRDFDAFIKPEVERAEREGKYVILSSHHATDRIKDGDVPGGVKQTDAVSQEEWESLVASKAVILNLVAHGHTHRVRRIESSGRSVWEVQTASLIDFPNQFRIVEVFDEDNGYLSIRSIAVDIELSGIPEGVRYAKELSVLDYTSGWGCCGPGKKEHRNVELFLPKP